MHVPWHEVVTVATPVGVASLTGFVAFRVGRRWRRQLREAVNYRQSLEAQVRAGAKASATAEASGNRVDIHVGDRQSLDARPGEFWVPSSLRAGVDRRLDGGEAVSGGDLAELPTTVDDYRPSAVSRFVLGRRLAWDGDRDVGPLRHKSGEE